MRRLVELLKNNLSSLTRRPGRSLLTFAVLALTLMAFTSLAQAQTTVLQSDFEDGTTQSWGMQTGGTVVIENSTEAAHGGTHSLKTTGRTADWNGPSYSLANKFVAGQVYQISAWVRLVDGSVPSTVSNVQVKMTIKHDGENYYTVGTADNAVYGQWYQIQGTYTPATVNDPLLYIEAPAEVSFYIDDVVITGAPAPTNPCDTPDNTGFVSNFEDGVQGWTGDYNATLAQSDADKHSGTYSLLVSGRAASWAGPNHDITAKMCPGNTYRLTVWAKMAPGKPDTTLRASVKRKVGSTTNYEGVIPNTLVTANGWVELRGTYSMPPANTYDSLTFYIESDTGSDDFYMDDMSLVYIQPPAVESIPGVAAAYSEYFPVGAAVYSGDLTGVHADLLARHFNSVTAENAMKWDTAQPTEGTFDYDEGDAIVAFAQDNDMSVRGHTLVWHKQTPDWVFQNAEGVDMSTLPYSDANRQLLLDRMKTHIKTMIAHYGAAVTAWDVVNEPFDETQTDGFRHSKWYTITGGDTHGADYIDLAFQYAKEAVDALEVPAGTIKLYLNEFNTTVPAKRTLITDWLSGAATREVPVDGIGHQFHNSLDFPIDDLDHAAKVASITDTINAVHNLGFDNQITEFDVSIYRNSAPRQTIFTDYYNLVADAANDLIIQGYRYKDYFDTFKALATDNKISLVTVWGQGDDHTWKDAGTSSDSPFVGTTIDAPLLFDIRLQHKAAYDGVMGNELGNALPYAADGNVRVVFNTAASVVLPGSDANGDTLTFAVVSGPAHGALGTLTGNTATYTPTESYFGPDTITYTANDGTGTGNVGQINITVLPQPPVALDQTVVVGATRVQPITLTATGDGTMVYSVVDLPQHGTLTGTAPELTYTVEPDYLGTDSFTFKANNGTDSNVATIHLSVLPNGPINANDQSVVVHNNTPLAITLTATGEGTITYRIAADPAHGTLTGTAPDVTYTPTTDYQGADSFTFIANNGADSNIATVTINVLNAKPVAQGQLVSVDYRTATPITISATGPGTITYEIVDYPLHGDLSGTAPNFTYTPNVAGNTDPTLAVQDSFTFKAGNLADNGEYSDVATVSIIQKPAEFKMAPMPGAETTVNMSVGGTAVYHLQISGWTGATNSVNFTCGGIPNFSTCTITPNAVTLNGTNAIPFTVTIQTTASGAAAIRSGVASRPASPWIPVSAFAALLGGLFFGRKARRSVRLMGAFFVLVVFISMLGCGSSSKPVVDLGNTTRPGSYTVVVTAATTTAQNGLSTDMELALNLN